MLPSIFAASKPLPNSIPFMPGTEKTAWEITDSKESKKGSPIPTGIFNTKVSTIPPMESPSSFAFKISASIFSLEEGFITGKTWSLKS